MSSEAYYVHRRSAQLSLALRIGDAKARAASSTGLLDLASPFVFEMRVRRSDATTRQGYLFTAHTGEEERYAVIEGYGNGIEWYSAGTGGVVRASFGAAPDGAFHTYRVEHDGTDLRTYRDGVLKETIPGAPLGDAGTAQLVLGGTLANDGTDNWPGDFDYFRFARQAQPGGALLPVLDWQLNGSLVDNRQGLVLQMATPPLFVTASTP